MLHRQSTADNVLYALFLSSNFDQSNSPNFLVYISLPLILRWKICEEIVQEGVCTFFIYDSFLVLRSLAASS